MGGQLERAEAFGYGALPCRRCGGKWKKSVVTDNGEVSLDGNGKPLEDFATWRDGTGRKPKHRIGKRGKPETYAMALARYRVEQQRALKIVISAYPKPSPSSGVEANTSVQ